MDKRSRAVMALAGDPSSHVRTLRHPGPVSLGREAKDLLGQLELDIVSEINQREEQFNIAPT
ncbi:hypothetical protein [Luteibacter jiangsuensis]|uniref:hypothetical protein n=1 Tax=Luteibacter jiangsuensis TaxID=637577 RepID=UPI0014243B98|nr:hypothetical protein [Luteibacter jiangsuensis]